LISNFDYLNKLFKQIDENLSDKVNFYIIGGAVMLYYDLKKATKDVDIIVNNPKEFKAIERCLKNLEFEAKIPTVEYKNFDLNQIFVKDDYRIDLFQRSVCKGFILSKKMIQRAKKISTLENLSIYLCSITDIFMLKTFTERPGDIDDCLSLVKKEIEWKDMLLELKDQIKTSEQDVWITWIGERLDILEERGLEIPIMKKFNILREKYFDDLEKKLIKNKES
jgi:hypothetical protein